MTVFEAIQANDMTTLQALIKAGADLYATDETGETPLTLAAGLGRLVVVRSLLAAGVPPDHGICSTPLEAAAAQGYAEVVRELLAAGVALPADGEALMAAAAGGYVAVVRLLVQAGADVNAEDELGQTALSLAATRGHREVVEYLWPLSSAEHRTEGEQAVAREQEYERRDRGEIPF